RTMSHAVDEGVVSVSDDPARALARHALGAPLDERPEEERRAAKALLGLRVPADVAYHAPDRSSSARLPSRSLLEARHGAREQEPPYPPAGSLRCPCFDLRLARRPDREALKLGPAISQGPSRPTPRAPTSRGSAEVISCRPRNIGRPRWSASG